MERNYCKINYKIYNMVFKCNNLYHKFLTSIKYFTTKWTRENSHGCGSVCAACLCAWQSDKRTNSLGANTFWCAPHIRGACHVSFLRTTHSSRRSLFANVIYWRSCCTSVCLHSALLCIRCIWCRRSVGLAYAYRIRILTLNLQFDLCKRMVYVVSSWYSFRCEYLQCALRK